MPCHQIIKLVQNRLVNRHTSFPGKKLLPELLTEHRHGFSNSTGTLRTIPFFPEGRNLVGIQETSRVKPAQDGEEIREQLDGLSVLDGSSIDEIQGQLVSKEEESILAVRLASCTAGAHALSSKKVNTDNETFYRLARPISRKCKG